MFLSRFARHGREGELVYVAPEPHRSEPFMDTFSSQRQGCRGRRGNNTPSQTNPKPISCKHLSFNEPLESNV